MKDSPEQRACYGSPPRYYSLSGDIRLAPIYPWRQGLDTLGIASLLTRGVARSSNAHHAGHDSDANPDNTARIRGRAAELARSGCRRPLAAELRRQARDDGCAPAKC